MYRLLPDISRAMARLPYSCRMTRIHPRKLLLSKWTAVKPVDRQKHFIVLKVLEPEVPDGPVVWVDIEAVYSGKISRLPWRELCDDSVWRQGWV